MNQDVLLLVWLFCQCELWQMCSKGRKPWQKQEDEEEVERLKGGWINGGRGGKGRSWATSGAHFDSPPQITPRSLQEQMGFHSSNPELKASMDGFTQLQHKYKILEEHFFSSFWIYWMCVITQNTPKTGGGSRFFFFFWTLLEVLVWFQSYLGKKENAFYFFFFKLRVSKETLEKYTFIMSECPKKGKTQN